MGRGNMYLYILNYVKSLKWPHVEAGKAKLVQCFPLKKFSAGPDSVTILSKKVS
jgi:hypothetical protein